MLSFAGLPCKPFCKERVKNGTTCNTGPVRGHSDIGTVDEFQLYLEVRKPRMFIVEESDAMSFRVEKERNETYCDLFMTDCATRGYSCRARVIDHFVFSSPHRPRTWILGVHSSAGGGAAADWIMDRVGEVLRHQEMCPNPDPWAIVNVHSDIEQERLSRVKAFFFFFPVVMALLLISGLPSSPSYSF